MDYFKVLGLNSNATEEDIKQAYKELAVKYNSENYEQGPLKDEAAQKMDEINVAFDALMSNIRTGTVQASNATSADSNNVKSAYSQARAQINSGDADGALSRLHAIANGSDDAEWNFLVGSAYYYKGWLGDAMRYFEAACNIEPTNNEYQAALRNLRNNSNGAMPGNPYGNRQYQSNNMGCSCCDMCTAMMCMDMCCGCGNGC